MLVNNNSDYSNHKLTKNNLLNGQNSSKSIYKSKNDLINQNSSRFSENR